MLRRVSVQLFLSYFFIDRLSVWAKRFLSVRSTRTNHGPRSGPKEERQPSGAFELSGSSPILPLSFLRQNTAAALHSYANIQDSGKDQPSPKASSSGSCVLMNKKALPTREGDSAEPKSADRYRYRRNRTLISIALVAGCAATARYCLNPF